MTTKKELVTEKVSLSSPWQIYYKKLNVMFANDKQIKMFYDEATNEIKMYVDNDKKAAAIASLLPTEKQFGNVTIKISVIPANGRSFRTPDNIDEIIEDAFEGNYAFKYVKTYRGVYNNPLTYVVFENKVVQIYTDNMGDINGFTSTLYEEIAREIFIVDHIYYCTDTPNYLYASSSTTGRININYNDKSYLM